MGDCVVWGSCVVVCFLSGFVLYISWMRLYEANVLCLYLGQNATVAVMTYSGTVHNYMHVCEGWLRMFVRTLCV